MSNPFFSVIVPTYNRAHLKSETIESVLAQTQRKEQGGGTRGVKLCIPLKSATHSDKVATDSDSKLPPPIGAMRRWHFCLSPIVHL